MSTASLLLLLAALGPATAPQGTPKVAPKRPTHSANAKARDTRGRQDGRATMTTRTFATLVLAFALQGGCALDEIEYEDASGEQDFPVRMAEAYCAAFFACNPVETCWDFGEASPYSSEDECVATERGLLEEVRTAGRDAGLTYDPECVETSIARYAAIGCDNSQKVQFRDEHLFESCPPYYGTIPEGENPCFEIVGSALTECGRGLYCDSDLTCREENTASCECEAGSTCRTQQGLADTCLPIVADGEDCYGADFKPHTACGVESYCDIEIDGDGQVAILLSAICRPRQPLGTPCDNGGVCSSYSCMDGVCAPPSPLLCSDGAAPRRWR